MKVRKANKRATYFEGNFYLRDENKNWANPIKFPTVFIAYGKAIKSGNWQSCTAINTPQYVIDNYFSGKNNNHLFWDAVFALENITWQDVSNDKERVLKLINNANNQLMKFKEV